MSQQKPWTARLADFAHKTTLMGLFGLTLYGTVLTGQLYWNMRSRRIAAEEAMKTAELIDSANSVPDSNANVGSGVPVTDTAHATERA
ncbi:hypothetical protein SAICODRAFT_18796 [Saitoella complicata NRRL Y-17804]|uniref:uncharacterized protein n=1 Tax=Saitoella complicata (strain BCRC 22490 / CBS 7301 / JCM 7358 / NBRC 10748 / NRRL Y-17804) TaxID=698492 RepID=UPI0008681B22|nr:uncharacterized protein SAICODRAFT_18796 [Saitoella complicata NRRL Y-17804]ODQ53772.1 hypothetical protein SAICODRAFT_18796 [Saitoella complicata NRRL Y-17804]